MDDASTCIDRAEGQDRSVGPPFRQLPIAHQVACGFLMGGADVIPGVSGGTVALVLGIYPRLVTAISQFDRRLWSHLKRKQVAAASRHIDFPFLASLGTGILLGVVTLGGFMHELLSHSASRPYALSALFGLVAASALFVAKLILRGDPAPRAWSLSAGIVGALFAFWLTQLTAVHSSTAAPYVFFCGFVAICAMILPGISGAYLLLILGLYDHMTGILKALPRGGVTAGDLVTLAVFAAGCAVGLVSFSKLLRWLLQRYGGVTMAMLCGFMVGALPKVWPFQTDLTPRVTELSHKRFENTLPDWNLELLACLAIAAASCAAVLYLDSLATTHHRHRNRRRRYWRKRARDRRGADPFRER